MKVRYCLTPLRGQNPCLVGWGAADKDGCRTCQDEPIEENCHNIVDTEDYYYCPTCGVCLGYLGDFMRVEYQNS